MRERLPRISFFSSHFRSTSGRTRTSLPFRKTQIEGEEHALGLSNSRSLNIGRPSLSTQAISPSMTALSTGCPPPASMFASARKPSILNS
jgi:hypothetical protein